MPKKPVQNNPTRPQQEVLVHVAKFLKQLENIENASPHTLRAYKVDLTQALKGFSGPANKILTAVRTAMNSWAHLSLATRNRKAASLKSFLNYLYDQQIIDSPLGEQLRTPKVPQKLPHYLSVDEVMAVIKSYKSEESQERLLFLLLYGGGLRISEACNLKWTDFDPQRRTLRVLGKGKKERLIVIPESLQSELSTLKTRHTKVLGVYLFGSSPLSTRKAYEWIRSRGAKAGLIKPLHPHALRHSFATHILSSGANLRTLQELLGHESLTATQKYTHLGVDQLARTLNQHHPLGQNKRSK